MGSWLEGHLALQGLAEALFKAGLSWPFNKAPWGGGVGREEEAPRGGVVKCLLLPFPDFCV